MNITESTHYAACSVSNPLTGEELHCERSINIKDLLRKVANDGYLCGENLDIFNDKLIFHLDNGNKVIVYLHTLH